MAFTFGKSAAGFVKDDDAAAAGYGVEKEPRSRRFQPGGPGSVAGSVAGRSIVTSASRYTQKTETRSSRQSADDRRPAHVRNLEAFANYLYSRDTGRILGRTPLNFLALIVSYMIFYLLVAILVSVCYVFFSYIVVNEDTPRLTGDHSILRFSPVLGMRPMPDFMGSLIRFRQTRPESYLIYTSHLQAYLDQYELFYNTERDVNIVDCDIQTGHRESGDPNDPCRFDLGWLGPCSKQGFFGYPRGSPCVLLKLNRVYGWIPDITSNGTSPNMLLRCQGRTDTDTENMGQIKYFPSEDINGVEYGVLSPMFYPYLTQVGYRSPLVAAQFTNPRRNVVIMVECAVHNVRNIQPAWVPRADKLTFELMID